MTSAASEWAGARARLSLADHQTLRRPGEVAISADGAGIAWSLPAAACIDPPDGARSAIWVVVGDGEPRQLTDGRGVATLPRWSPDGASLAYAADAGHAGRLSPRVQRLADHSETELEGIPGSVEDLRWSGDGRRLLVLAADLGSDRAGSFQATRITERGAGEEDPHVFRPRRFYRRLFLVDLDGRVAEAGPPGLTVWEADWDGSRLAALIVSADPTESGWYRPSLLVWDLVAGEALARFDAAEQIAVPRLAPDGSAVAFITGFSSDRGDLAGVPMLARTDGAVLAPSPLTEVLEVSWLRWTDAGRLFFTAWRGLGSECGLLSDDGAIEMIWSGPATVGSRLCARVEANASAARLAAVVEAANTPPEICVLEVGDGGEWRRLTSFNGHLLEFELPEWREHRWRGEDGLELEGLLVLPHGLEPAALPLVVLVHGGPTTSWTYAWISDIPRFPLLWADAGYAVLLPNPRGSRGYGQAFARANIGDMGGADLADIVSGVDSLVTAGIADRDRVGITGNSYGGFMAAIAVGKTDRFAASIPMAVISNWLSFHNTSNSGAFDEIFLEADPYSPGGPYHDCSPVVYARNVTAPTLIIQGERDLCTPVGQAQELYQAIAEHARAEVELVVLPREGHSYTERGHQQEIWSRSRAWFDRHLEVRPS